MICWGIRQCLVKVNKSCVRAQQKMNEVVNFGKHVLSDIICRALWINIICKNWEYEKASKIAKRISFLLAVSWLSSIKGILKWILHFIFNNQTDFYRITSDQAQLIGSSVIFCSYLFLPIGKYFCFMYIPPILEVNYWVWIFGEIWDRVSISVERTLPRFWSTNKMNNFYILSKPLICWKIAICCSCDHVI